MGVGFATSQPDFMHTLNRDHKLNDTSLQRSPPHTVIADVQTLWDHTWTHDHSVSVAYSTARSGLKLCCNYLFRQLLEGESVVRKDRKRFLFRLSVAFNVHGVDKTVEKALFSINYINFVWEIPARLDIILCQLRIGGCVLLRERNFASTETFTPETHSLLSHGFHSQPLKKGRKLPYAEIRHSYSCGYRAQSWAT